MLPKKIIDGKKLCTRCNIWRLLSDYNKGKSKDGSRSQCRNCERDYKMMLRYKLTKENVEDFWNRTHCEICDVRFIDYGSGRGRFKCIDHDHATGLARGVLCNSCNAGIGYLSDDITVIKNVIKYLKYGGSLTTNLEKELEKAELDFTLNQ